MADSKLKERRELRFKSVDDITADVGKLAQAERNQKLRKLGNWTLGQACGHIATWIDYGYDGAPVKFSWLVRMLARGRKKKYIEEGMQPGGRLPKAPSGTYGTEVLGTEAGIEKLKNACARLKGTTPKPPHFVFGKLKPEEWRNLHMRHAELHLSFFRMD